MIDLITGHPAVMGQNFLTLVLGLAVALYYGRLWLRSDPADPARLMMIGIAAGGFGWAVHRGYWWLWRLELALGHDEKAEAFLDNADYLIFAVALIGCSYLIHLNRWARQAFGSWAWPVLIAGGILVYLIGALPGLL